MNLTTGITAARLDWLVCDMSLQIVSEHASQPDAAAARPAYPAIILPRATWRQKLRARAMDMLAETFPDALMAIAEALAAKGGRMNIAWKGEDAGTHNHKAVKHLGKAFAKVQDEPHATHGAARSLMALQLMLEKAHVHSRANRPA